jgi:hypothetical protein
MSPSTSGTLATHDETERVCLTCGVPVEHPVDGRCPRCGERLPTGDASGEDLTPYAVALAEGRRGWWRMVRWVCGANRQRLTHVGLLRPSRASRRFARWNTLLLAVAVAFAVFANAGFRSVRRGPATIIGRAEPLGKGWWQAVHPSGGSLADGQLAALWWNPPWAITLAAAAFALTTIIASIVIASVGRGAQRSLRGELRGQQRLRCAVHYSTAWLTGLALGAVLSVLAPLNLLSEALRGPKVSGAVAYVPAVLVTVGVGLSWWFWCIRLGQTTPQSTRSAVTRYFLVWAPLLAALLVGATAYGVWIGSPLLAQRLNLSW